MLHGERDRSAAFLLLIVVFVFVVVVGATIIVTIIARLVFFVVAKVEQLLIVLLEIAVELWISFLELAQLLLVLGDRGTVVVVVVVLISSVVIFFIVVLISSVVVFFIVLHISSVVIFLIIVVVVIFLIVVLVVVKVLQEATLEELVDVHRRERLAAETEIVSVVSILVAVFELGLGLALVGIELLGIAGGSVAILAHELLGRLGRELGRLLGRDGALDLGSSGREALALGHASLVFLSRDELFGALRELGHGGCGRGGAARRQQQRREGGDEDPDLRGT